MSWLRTSPTVVVYTAVDDEMNEDDEPYGKPQERRRHAGQLGSVGVRAAESDKWPRNRWATVREQLCSGDWQPDRMDSLNGAAIADTSVRDRVDILQFQLSRIVFYVRVMLVFLYTHFIHFNDYSI